MKRRDFIALSGVGVGSSLFAYPTIDSLFKNKIKWEKIGVNRLFHQVSCDNTPLVGSKQLGLLNANIRISDSGHRTALNPENDRANLLSLKLNLAHRLKTSGLLGEDVLEATLSIENQGHDDLLIDVAFTTAAQPSTKVDKQKIYIPISATALNKDPRHAEFGSDDFLQECEQKIGEGSFSCHYLEPMASSPNERKTKALLLAPVINIENDSSKWKVALFTPSDQPYRFGTIKDGEQKIGWEAKRTIEIKANQKLELKCYLHCHKGEADTAWKAFHKLAHTDELKPIGWLNDVKVHYYDFLSSAKGQYGLRGDGYEADISHFRDFKIGLATQHGYYPYIGDFLDPNRKDWLAMQGDAAGPAHMSIQKMKDRISATRKMGSRAGVYMHTVLFDEGSPLFSSLQDSILIDPNGEKKGFEWVGPDTVKQNWWMSFAAEDWRNHLLKQVEYIMEILDPDAIVFDETFVCLGYDHHPDRKGPLSTYSIPLFKEIRNLIRSFGEGKALITSDCGGSNIVMWADADGGDHSYPKLLGNPLYREKPIRYKAALGQKPWVPCSWHFLKMWDEQIDLAKKTGSAIGVSNGWIEFNGLHGLDLETRGRLIKDINNLY
ncbi:hypothetical protein [Zobellia russellii]|uniref:hypothetical protein n=1 Tax=Zobellia russellii TaxID=248907 RepID=UPI001BFF9E99|nr:hypothetical protein [Zobellia russellii]MBT9189516.1 hypothetical protein [Zobellia russellii]